MSSCLPVRRIVSQAAALMPVRLCNQHHSSGKKSSVTWNLRGQREIRTHPNWRNCFPFGPPVNGRNGPIQTGATAFLFFWFLPKPEKGVPSNHTDTRMDVPGTKLISHPPPPARRTSGEMNVSECTLFGPNLGYTRKLIFRIVVPISSLVSNTSLENPGSLPLPFRFLKVSSRKQRKWLLFGNNPKMATIQKRVAIKTRPMPFEESKQGRFWPQALLLGQCLRPTFQSKTRMT